MSIEALKLALEALENSVDLVREDAYNAEKLYGNYPSRQGKVAGLKVLADDHEKAITAIKVALAAPVQEPVAWVPITEPYPPGDELDILMGDGSILCAVLPQADGDLWWGGSGTGEKFIDPQYTNVTHWRIHSDTTPPAAQREPDELTIAYMSGLYDGKKHAKQREWVGLTEEELDEAETEGGKSYKRWTSRIRGQMLRQQDSLQWHVSRAIEAKLKEKNT